MTKVFIVIDWDSETTANVFSTLGKAQEYVKQHKMEHRSHIEEWEVDKGWCVGVHLVDADS